MKALFERSAKARIDPDFELGVSQGGPAAAVPSRFRFPFGAIGHASAMVDALAVVVASLVGGAGYQIVVYQSAGHLGTLAAVGIVAALLHGLIGQSLALYQIRAILAFRRNIREIVGIWIAVTLLLTLLAFLMKVGAEFSRGSIVCFSALALPLVLGSRWLASRLAKFAVAADHVQGRRVILVGSQDELSSLEDRILLRHFGLSAVERIVIAGHSSGGGPVLSPREIGALDRAILAGRRSNAAEIVLAFSWSDGRKLELARDYLRASPLPVQLLPDSRIRTL